LPDAIRALLPLHGRTAKSKVLKLNIMTRLNRAQRFTNSTGNRLVVVICTVLFCFQTISSFGALAGSLDEQYLQIHELVRQGEDYEMIHMPDRALAKYREAQKQLLKFQRQHPEYDPKMVAFRLGELSRKLTPVSPKAAATNAQNAATTAQAANSGGNQIDVQLIEAGAEPRQTLRFHPKAGDKQSFTMTLKMGMDMQMAGMPSTPMKMPLITMIFDSTVSAVAPSGDITYDTVVRDLTVADDPDVNPMIAQVMKKTMGSMKGMSGNGVVSDRGMIRKMDMKLPADADAQTRQTIEQMRENFSRSLVVLPNEAIGAGAKWEVKMPLKSQGMKISQTGDFELVSFEADTVTAKTTLIQTAANQKISSPAMPSAKVDLTSMSGKGTGEVVLNLTHLMPSEAVMDFHSDMEMAMNAGGKQQQMAMKMDISTKMESAK
jgi:hypothetical protein